MTASQYGIPHQDAKDVQFADRLTVWSIWLLVIGGGMVRELLGQTLVFSLNFYSFHSIDPAIVLSATAAVAHILRGRFRIQAFTWPIFVIAALISMNFLRGMAGNSAYALLWLRSNGGVATVLLLAATMRPTLAVLNAVRRSLIVCALFLSILLLLRLATVPTLFMTADFSDLDVNDGGRALSTWGTFLMVLASAMLVSEFFQRKRLILDARMIFTFALPFLVFLTRQGTANIAEISALGSVILLQRGKLQSERLILGILGLAAMVILVSILIPQLSTDQQIAHRIDNLGTREQVWQSLLDLWPHISLIYQFFGYPSDELPQIYLGNNQEWLESIHSMYYGSLPMMGYIGGFCFIVVIIILIIQTFLGSQRKVNPFPAYPFACCVAGAILSVSYEMRGESLLCLFIPIWWLRSPIASGQGKSARPRIPVPAAEH